MPVPTARFAILFALAALPTLFLQGFEEASKILLASDLALLALFAWDARGTPGPGSLAGARHMKEPLSFFVVNRVALTLSSRWERSISLELADAPPKELDSRDHRRRLRLRKGETLVIEYEAVPKKRGRVRFGDLHLKGFGPLGLAARQWRLPLSRDVEVYPDLASLAAAAGAERLEQGRARSRLGEGREFASLRPYEPGDDIRAVDWKATARMGSPVVREWQPERNQVVWILLDCGRRLGARLADGRRTLDHAVDAALGLARAAALRQDRTGAVLFSNEVLEVVLPEKGLKGLGKIAEALHRAEPRAEEPDYGAAFDALSERQKTRSLVIVFTDLDDRESGGELRRRAARLARRHKVLLVTATDSELSLVAEAFPRDLKEAYARVAAERILWERELARAALSAVGVRNLSAPAEDLRAAVVNRYLEVKRRGEL